jgi:spermidine synthase
MNQTPKPPVSDTTLPSPVVEQDGESVIMSFDEVSVQSRMRLDDPTALDLDYSRVMMAFLLLQPQPASILMIGLGGGSLAKYCHRHLPQARITVVEINPEVIAARDTFQVPADGELFSVVQGDGAAFLATSPRDSYDVILVDGFGADGEQPEALCSLAFYKACRAALRPSGVLMVNLQDQEPQCSRLIGRIWQMFGEPVLPLEVACGGNLVVLAGDDAAFKACAGSLRRRWRALDAVHQATLDDVLPGLEEELKPWWTPPAKDKKPVARDEVAAAKPKVQAASTEAKIGAKKASVQRKRSGGRR